MLDELENDWNINKNSKVSSSIYDIAPDLSTLTNVYTLYIYDGSYNYNGNTYSYRYIKVIDDKGYNGLTQDQEFDAISKYSSHYLEEILKYNFGYIFSTLLSKTPIGVLTDWTLGNIFSVLRGRPDSAVVTSTKDGIYKITHTSVTSMTYYWIYNNSWRYIGAEAHCDVARTDFWAGNIGGVPTHESKESQWSTHTDGIWYNYLEDYINVMSWNPSFCNIKRLGSFSIKGENNSVTFTPRFAARPNDLV